MQIRYLPKEEKQNIRPLYEAVFEDSKAYVDVLFSEQIAENEVLVLENDDKICSMLQLVKKRMVYQGRVCDIHYIFAVATDENERKKGYMEKLLLRACSDLKMRGEPFTYLVPVNPAVYKKFGFRVAYLKSMYVLDEKISERRVYEPNTMDAVILQKFCEAYLPKKYDTYLVHDEAYFNKVFRELKLEKGYLLYHMDGQHINGYSLVASDGTVFDSLWHKKPDALRLTGYVPWIMVKDLGEECHLGRLWINDET